MANSPYAGHPISQWKEITNNLVKSYPISTQEILNVAELSWDRLWQSVIGGEIRLDEVELPATVVGYFFQKLFSLELSRRYPNDWTGEKLKSDKDLVNLKNNFYSTEMKSSGQLGYSIYGNRSYNQQTIGIDTSGKDKSGFYITVNFYGNSLTLIQLGWIDQDDWVPQGAATGQAATLSQHVYDYKLHPIYGRYMLSTPIGILNGIGPKATIEFNNENVFTFNDLINYRGFNDKINSARNANKKLFDIILSS